MTACTIRHPCSVFFFFYQLVRPKYVLYCCTFEGTVLGYSYLVSIDAFTLYRCNEVWLEKHLFPKQVVPHFLILTTKYCTSTQLVLFSSTAAPGCVAPGDAKAGDQLGPHRGDVQRREMRAAVAPGKPWVWMGLSHSHVAVA